jgi:hypothetical protein
MIPRSIVRRLRARRLHSTVAVGVATVAALGVSVLPAQAQATLHPFARVWGSPENRASLYFFGNTLDDYAGAQDTILSGWGGPDLQFDTYCINIEQNVVRSPYPVNIRSTDEFNLGNPGVPQGGAAAWLYNNYVDIAFFDNRESAALQLAIWEAIYDWDGISFVGGTNTSIDLSAGNFRYLGNPAVPGPGIDPIVTADITARANAMFTTWQGQTDTATWYEGIGNPKPQDLIGKTPRIPEPGTLALGVLGAGCWVLGRRRRRR